MRIIPVLAISLIVGLPVLAQAPAGSNDSGASTPKPAGMPAGQAYGHGNVVGPDGIHKPGSVDTGNGTHHHHRTEQQKADRARGKMEGASTIKSYGDSASSVSVPSNQSVVPAAPAQTSAPVQPSSPTTRKGVQTY